MQASDHEISLMELTTDDRHAITWFGHATPNRALAATDRSSSSMPDAKDSPKPWDEGEGVVEHYFGDVRDFSLLKHDQERALWQRIERLKYRSRRILLTSPTAHATLTRVWNQMKHGELASAQVLAFDPNDERQRHEDAFGQVVAARQHLDLAAPRRVRWQCYQAWHPSWAALKCKDNLYDLLHVDLQRAHEGYPGDAELDAAWRAWWRVQGRLEQAKARMLHANLRFVIYVARTYRNTDLPLLDLVQEGNIGLMRAVDKFEPERGVKFITYAYWWIRQAIGRGIIQQGRTIRLPSHTVERHQKLIATARKFRQEHGQIADDETLGVALGYSPQDIEDLRQVTQPTIPLQTAQAEDRDLASTLPAAPDLAPDERLSHAELQQCIVNSLSTLAPREAFILRQRFGFDEEPKSLRAIGESLGLSRERVRQIEQSALKRLRQSANEDALADFIL